MSGRGFILPNAIFPPDFPKLNNWDHGLIRGLISKLPSKRAFWDFMDTSTHVFDPADNLISETKDLSGNGFHWTSSGAFRPLLTSGAWGSPYSFAMPYFDGTKKMENPAVFSGAERMTLMAGFYATGATDATSRTLLTDADNSQPAWYMTQTQLRMFAGDIALNVPAINTRMVHMVSTVDNVGKIVSIDPSIAANPTTATMVRPKPVGGAKLGMNVAETGNFIGYLAYMAIIDEDVRNNPIVAEYCSEYSRRRLRTTV